MAYLKAQEIDPWLAKPRQSVPVVLIYGPDRGLVSERAQRYAALTGLKIDDPFTVVRLEAGEVDRDPGRLIDEANTMAMFAGQRLIWVRNGAGQKGLADAVKLLCANPAPDALLLVEAGELKKTAVLRVAVETSPNGLAIPCYADDGRSIDALIEDELAKAGMSIDSDAKQLLRRSLGGDRMASRGEIQKLVVYAQGQKTVQLEDVRALTGDVSAISVDDIVGAMLDGNVSGFDAQFSRHANSGSQAYPVLAGAIRQLQSLHLMRGAMDKERRSASSMVASARPPIFFSRRRAVEEALERWNVEGLSRALSRLEDAVLQTRRRPDLAGPIARQALLGVAVESARRSRRS